MNANYSLDDYDTFSFGYGYRSGAVDLDGNRVKRTKQEYPYSYDGFVLTRYGKNSEINGCVYSDRLNQWDYDLTSRLMKKHLDQHQGWSGQSLEAIQSFLRERLDLPNLRLIVVMEWCNMASGYPLWSFHYHAP